ncbi:ABC transporter substrate-binding protein [Streptomyces sp. NPDC091972]|uniref:ABC transporter substrate-binding protein n=1 Tax=Streptomyces sp. NPDC091972 TaxID=3366007 RepID=UPI00381BEE29
MAKHIRSASFLAALTTGALALLAGCGSGSASDSGSSTADAGVTAVKVGTSPTLTNASLYLAMENGTFKKHKLKATPQVVTSGAQALPLLLNGQIQFTAADPMGAIKALKEKMPIKIIGQGSVNTDDPAKDSTVLVVGDDKLKAPKDLSGKTVAVNALGGLAQVAAQSAIDMKGGKSSDVKFVEMSFPQMIAAVQSGKVDGAVLNEPFVSQARSEGLKDLMPVMSTSIPTVPNIVYLTSESYAKSHPEVVKEFANSLDAANAALSTDPEKIRQVAEKSTETKPDVLAKIILPTFPAKSLDQQPLQNLQELMVKYDILDAPIDLAPHFLAASS